MATTVDLRLDNIMNIGAKQRTLVKLAAGATLVRGGFVMVKSDGFAIGTGSMDLAGAACAGIATETITNSGANGDVTTFAEYGHTVPRKLHASVTIAEIGKTVYVVDNETVGRAADTSNTRVAGVLRTFDGANSLVQIAPLAQNT